ncbi:hypothetical protein ENH_00012310 [Eimeria necatrix]|uniref:Transmembrane protein n=1 Tax=Eimeria necatrix TaxID=51315 RepID=U6MKX2_9EIME|nr:hypothetical protein ENH_00012310 [Eimeria necatrix]CDJ62305.1 hypothetical protein ENH_00012310 [Eimeria necatrix]
MDTLPEEQLKQGMLASSITHQGSDSHLRMQIDQHFADESPFIQRKESNKLFVSSWTRLLGVAFTSLAAAYFLLLCFRFVESARQWSPPTRFLADRRVESCYSGSVSGDGDEGGSWPTGDSAGLVLEGFGEGSPLLHHEASGLQGAAGGTQEEVVAAGLQGAAGGAEAEVDLEAEADEEIWEFAGGVASNPQIQDDLHLWEGRNMPVEEEERLLRLFEGMQEAASSCRSLLPMLTNKQRLELTKQVLKLISLDLGAICLVKEDKEPHRRAVGDSLIQLANDALEQVKSASYKKHRVKIKNLVSLINELKKPRHLEREKSADKYKRKMIAILATAEVAQENCMGVLNGLLQLRQDTLAGQLRRRTVEQQIEVIASIFTAHSDHLARDTTLRQHILHCQKHTGVYALLTTDHFKVSSNKIAPVKVLRNRILEAVRDAGGLLQAQQLATHELDSASGELEKRIGHDETEMEQPGPKPPEKDLVETVQSSPYATAAAARTGVGLLG